MNLRRSPQRDPVTPALRDAVLRRDQMCVLVLRDPLHVCRDRWGRPHAEYAIDRLTIEHVHDGYGMAAKRAPSDLAHCVALCWGANSKPPSKNEREWMRAYLARVT